MSLDVDLGEFLSAYLAEADEHVAAANAKLLLIERAVRADGADPRAVRDLYRTLHTLKGLSAMVGVDPIVAIAHAMETIVRAADRAGRPPVLEAIELLYEALRAIADRLGVLGRGESASGAPKGLLDRLEKAPLPGGHRRDDATLHLDLDPEIDQKLASFEREQLVDGARDGKRAVRVDFVPSPARAGAGFTINSVRDRLGAFADIVKVVPLSVPVSEAAPGGLCFALLIVTAAEDAPIASAAGVQSEDVVTIAAAPIAALESLVSEAHLPDDDVAPSRRGALRVDVARIDDAMERLAVLLVTRSRLARTVAELAASGVQTRELQTIVHEATRQFRDLRASILALRMVPFADVLSRLPLVVRSLERANHKEVRLVTEANDVELDKSVAERVFPVLIHILRNAVDHGIEAAPERLGREKPPYGTVRVTCTMVSNRLMQIRVADDGGGIDHEEIARSAGRSVASTGTAILEALCRPGVSTRREASATSGRGMGMDIVRKVVVDQLGGEIDLETTRGAGTTFTLRIPLTVAVLEAFTVECEGEVFAVPVAAVEEIVELDPARVFHGPGDGARRISLLQRRGEAVPLVHLMQALGRVPDAGAPARHALIVRRGAAVVAFRLDRVRGQQETVVRPLLDPLVQAPGIAGSADLGDGRATLVLDLPALAARIGAQTMTLEART